MLALQFILETLRALVDDGVKKPEVEDRSTHTLRIKHGARAEEKR